MSNLIIDMIHSRTIAIRDGKLEYYYWGWLNLSSANLSYANLSSANLSYANLSSANLSSANLSYADLSSADLSYADLSYANLSSANLSYADLSSADLSYADLSYANLSYANLSSADLSYADLSSAKEFQSPSKWIFDNLEKADDGIIVYKRFGYTEYKQPSSWVIKTGSVIEDNCNPDRGTACGCGVNVGTRSWCDKHYQRADLWKCLIRWEWLAGVVVPFNTDGKIRCEKLELIERI